MAGRTIHFWLNRCTDGACRSRSAVSPLDGVLRGSPASTLLSGSIGPVAERGQLPRGEACSKGFLEPVFRRIGRTSLSRVGQSFLSWCRPVPALTLGAILLLPGATAAQDVARPRIGLALAGGSARGLAHIGVIQWLEENRIPIDAIGGTSMGGLVAGMYATGSDSAEMVKFVSEIDWDQALAAGPPFRQLSFRRKEDELAFPTKLEFGFKKGIKLPPGLSAGHGVGLVLSRFTAPYTEMSSFDDLPTPFRCVATDLAEGRIVVFERGDLFDALRATMSLPAIFAPVRLGNQVLVDGGVLNNLPVDVVKKMGVDIVIAVALDLVPEIPKIDTLLDVAGRSIDVMVMENERRNLGLADLVIMPEVRQLKSREFGRLEDFRRAGYEAVARKKQMLERFSVSEAEWSAYQAARRVRRKAEALRADSIEILGDVAPRRANALIVSLQQGGQMRLDRGSLEREMTKLTGMGRYDSADYRLVRRDGKDVLHVRVNEKRHGPPFLKVGLLIDGNQTEGLRFGIGGRFIFLDVGGPASEWRSEISAGRFNRISSEYYWRIKGTKWFLAPQFSWERTGLPVYDGARRVTSFDRSITSAGADFGYAFGRFQEIRAGYRLGQLDTVTFTGPDDVQALKGRTQAFRGRWAYDGQDSAVIPRHGLRGQLEAVWYSDYPGVSRQFPAASGQASWSRSIRANYILMLQAEGGATVHERSVTTYYDRGGLFRLSALAREQLLGGRFYYGSVFLLRSLPLPGRFYAGLGWESGNAWKYNQPTPRPYNDGILGFVGETPLGLIFIGGSVGEHGEGKALFRIGRYF